MALLVVTGYAVVGLLAGRVTYVWMDAHSPNDSDAVFDAVLVTVIWPLALFIGAIVAAGSGVIWLVSRPTPRQREEEAQAVRDRADEAMRDEMNGGLR